MDIRPDRKLGAACVALTACAVALAGCGGGSAGSLSSSSATRLRHDVAMIRVAVGGGDQAAALARIESLRGDIGRLAGSGRLARADATVLDQDAARLRASVESRLRPVSVHASTTTASSTTMSSPTMSSPTASARPPAVTPPAGGGPAPAGPGTGQGRAHPGNPGAGQSNGPGDAGASPLINALIHGNGWGYLKHLIGRAYRGEVDRLARAQDWGSLERLLQQYGLSGSGGGDGGN
jgi:hypothetical protein